MGVYGLQWTNFHLYQAFATILLSSDFLGPPVVAASRMVGQPRLSRALVLRGYRLLPFPVLACFMVLEAVLQKVCGATTESQGWSMQCDYSIERSPPAHFRPGLRRCSALPAYGCSLAVANVAPKESRPGVSVFVGSGVSYFKLCSWLSIHLPG